MKSASNGTQVNPETLLEVKNLQVHYGRLQALHSVEFKVQTGEIVALIGANGAGKTSVLRALSGLCETQGEIRFRGHALRKVPTHERVLRGLAQCPEGRGIFPNLSVEENLQMGAYFRKDKEQIKKDYEEQLNLFPRLKEREQQLAGTLSGGEQQMLTIARALLSRPTLLLLDEPSLGLAPKITSQIFSIILELNKKGMSLLLVEQNARMALRIAHRAYILESGRINKQGTGSELLNNDEVRKSYLGVG